MTETNVSLYKESLRNIEVFLKITPKKARNGRMMLLF